MENFTLSDGLIGTLLSFFGTILGLILMYFLKPKLDRALNKKNKSYGVIYDRKFIVYNDIYNSIYDHFNDLHGNYNNVPKYSTSHVRESLNKIKLSTLKNRLIIKDEVFIEVDDFLKKLNLIFSFKVNRIVVKHNLIEINEKYFTSYMANNKKFLNDLLAIEKLMKKDLDID